MAVEVKTSPGFEMGLPRALFTTRIFGSALGGSAFRYAVAPDGKRFLIDTETRESGSAPITVVEYQGRRYVQSPYGEVDWVRNLRAAGKATLQSGRRIEAITVRELNAEERAPILQVVLRRAPKVVQRMSGVTPDSPFEDFVKAAEKHPTFVVEAPP